jgi:hypothetical protein
LQEVAQREGVTKELIRGIRNKAECKLQARIAAEPLRPTARTAPPPGFDKQAFLRHMQGLIARREAKARETFEWERAALDRMLESEAAPPKPKPTPPPWVTPLYIPPTPVPHVASASPHQAVEPWFDPARTPTPSDLRCIAQYALGYLGAIRPRTPVNFWPLSTMGIHCAHVICTRHADAVAAAMQSLSRAIPVTAQLSACPLDVPKDMLGASLATAVGAMRVVSLAEGQQVSIEVTYD